MRVPVSWLRELVAIPAGDDVDAIGVKLVSAGLEIEAIDVVGEIVGPLVVGRIDSFEEQAQANGKTIRWCQVEVGPDHGGVRGIVCGAANFSVGDHVIAALPGAVLPGGFAIASRKTYGHISDGMICSAKELNLGDDHSGIMILDPSTTIGSDAGEIVGKSDQIFDLAVTPDRGYCFSMRGVARELSVGYSAAFNDPAAFDLPSAPAGNRAEINDGADRIIVSELLGFNPAAPTPDWLALRLRLMGMRPISLAVDVTNYVMLLTGQPLHAFDAAKVSGTLRVRRALAGEKLTTLDEVARDLDPDDVVIADDSGAVALAGTMGGASTEVDGSTSAILLEAAHFDPIAVARQSRRHKLSSEASRRFERGTDPALPSAASALAISLLVEHGGAKLASVSQVDLRGSTPAIAFDLQRPARTAGIEISDDFAAQALTSVGCVVSGTSGVVDVTPATWRPDLTDPADLDEEVIRLFGYDNVPSSLPRLPSGRGLTPAQRLRRSVAQTLAHAGHVEVLAYPFVGSTELDDLMIGPDDPRRQLVRLANPISEEQPFMRTTLLPGLLNILKRNLGRGNDENLIFEIGSVSTWPAGHSLARGHDVLRPSVTSRPDESQQAGLDASLPSQERHLAVVMTGQRERSGWWGPGRAVVWQDVVESARIIAQAAKVELVLGSGTAAPWHPGRCAQLSVGDSIVVGFAGELAPRVCESLSLPPRTCAMELSLDTLIDHRHAITGAPNVSTFPVAKEDIALVVETSVSVQSLQSTLENAAGPLLESIRLFDVYQGPQVGEGKQSLAFALRFRAMDRTLEDGEVAEARQAAVEAAQARHGAVLRS